MLVVILQFLYLASDIHNLNSHNLKDRIGKFSKFERLCFQN